MYPLSWASLPPPTPSHPSRLSQSPGLSLLKETQIQEIPTVYTVYFMCVTVYVSMQLSPFVPPSPS